MTVLLPRLLLLLLLAPSVLPRLLLLPGLLLLAPVLLPQLLLLPGLLPLEAS